LLQDQKPLTEDDRRGLQDWFGNFLNGCSRVERSCEAAAKNNHGTYYDLPVARLPLFVARKHLAVQVLEDAAKTYRDANRNLMVVTAGMARTKLGAIGS